MADQWLNLADATARLGCSVRTLHRKINAGELQSRLQPNGRRQVLLPEALPDSDPERHALRLAGGTAVLAERWTQDLRAEVQRTRRWGSVAWIGVFGLAIAVVVLLRAWTVRQQEAKHLSATLSDTRLQLAEARELAQEAIQGAVEDREQLTQALETAQADLQEAVLDAQEAARQKITGPLALDTPKFDLDRPGASDEWPELWGALNPFGQADIGIFAAGLTPGGQGEH